MNYRHIYHAGNFTDVFKHWIITLILQKLCAKPTPFCLIDTHAGLGLYDLQHQNAQKTLEHESGIAQLLDKQLAAEFQQYIEIVNRYLNQGIYPGSPAIMQAFLRPGDRLLLVELHPEDYAVLQANFKLDLQVKTFMQDAYLSLKALLPPKERRGFILIDPPFEQPNEIDTILQALKAAIKRFATGIYAIWYPIKDRKIIDKFYRNITDMSLANVLYVELHANENLTTQLTSCGMVIINAPWKLDEILQENMPRLIEYLNFEHGTFKFGNL